MDLNFTDRMFKYLFEKGGPDDDDFPILHEFADKLLPEQFGEFRKAFQSVLNPETLMGFMYTKPFGYSGDFFIIEKIY